MRSSLARALAAASVLVSPTLAQAQDGELTARPLGSTAAPYGYVEYLPPGYSAGAARHPLVLMLHGAGERGNGTSELGAVNVHGPTKQIQQGDTFWGEQGAIVIAPQVPSGGWWNADLVEQLLDLVVDERRVDAYQVVVTGISMGGGGTWDYVRARGRDRIAVALPICGASGPGDGAPFVTTATWAFHAWGDGTVGRGNSLGWVDNIADARAGADVASVLTGYPHQNGDTNQPAADDRTALFDAASWSWVAGVDASGSSTLRLTLYPDNSHDSWTRTYDAPAVKDWMFAHRRPEPEIAATADLVIDDLDEGAIFEGDWVREEETAGFYGWDEHRAQGGTSARATFAGVVPAAGRYEVFLSYAASADRAVVPVVVHHEAGSTTVAVDQKVGGGFTSLGEFDFAAETGPLVVIDAALAEGVVIADAVALRSIDGGTTTTVGSGGGNGSGGGGDGGGATGAGGDDDPSGAGGEGPASGPGATSATAGVGGSGDAADGAADDEGCSCRSTPGSDGPARGGAALVGLALVAAWRRRRG